MNWVFFTIAALILCLNGACSFVIARNSFLSSWQRLTQLLVVWLLPVLGAIICLAVAASQSQERVSGLDNTAFVDSADAGGPLLGTSGSGDYGGSEGGDCGGGDGGGGD